MIIISRATIGTHCTEKRARAVVSALQRHGYNATYGEQTQIPSNDPEFSSAFYAAMDAVDYPRNPGGKTP